MQPNQNISPQEEPQESFWKRNAPMLKAALIFVLVLLLLIPKTMIEDLIQERKFRQSEVLQEIAQSWGTSQEVSGPVLVLPYRTYYKNSEGQTVQTTKQAYFLPENLTVEGELHPEKLHRSIYDVVVYNSDLSLKGNFVFPNLDELNLKPDAIYWEDARIILGLSDLRGIDNDLAIDVNGKSLVFNSGTGDGNLLQRGVQAAMPMVYDSLQNQSFQFNLKLKLKGTENIAFQPVGKTTDVSLHSKWKDPSFMGSFSPDHREVNENGFEVNWNIIHLNRNFPQSWKGNAYNLNQSSFGVNLILPVDHYQKSTRSVKYAILFIALTFLIFFFIELINKSKVHPIQYILIGLALIIFYILLVSISEQWTFNGAYLVSAGATIALISLYAKSIFKQLSYTIITGGSLVILYGFIFTIIQLQDFALLIGSVGLFLIIAALMYFSRKIDWYNGLK